MNPPDLRALQTGDADAWDEAFRWLWPTVFAVAHLKLQPYFQRGPAAIMRKRTKDEGEPGAMWLWALGLAAAVIVLVALPVLRTPNAPVIQVAMLDTAGAVRGSDTNEVALLRETLSPATLNSFTSAEALRECETKGNPDAVKVIYNRAAAEVRVLGKCCGKPFEKTFLVDPDLGAALKAAKSFIAEQTKW